MVRVVIEVPFGDITWAQARYFPPPDTTSESDGATGPSWANIWLKYTRNYTILSYQRFLDFKKNRHMGIFRFCELFRNNVNFNLLSDARFEPTTEIGTETQHHPQTRPY